MNKAWRDHVNPQKVAVNRLKKSFAKTFANKIRVYFYSIKFVCKLMKRV